MDQNLEQFVPKVNFEQIPIKNLVSNQEYQRNISLSHVRRAAENFNLYQINPVKVSRRDGINYVFNGQHTIEIIAMISGSRDTPVWCMVYDDLFYEAEADIFANQLKYTKPLSPYEIFMANIEAGNDEQITIKALVESYNMKIAHNSKPGMICAVSALEGIYEKYGYHVLDRTLLLCIGTWEGDCEAFSANMMKGIAKLIATYGDKLKDDIFKVKAGAYSAKEVSRTAKDRRAGALGYAEALLLYYNKKMKYPLDMQLLYSGKKSEPANDNPSCNTVFDITPTDDLSEELSLNNQLCK